jgi:subfamily B ATP-binding cassette protein MsbA
VASLALLSPFLLLIFKKEDTLKAVANSDDLTVRLNPISYFSRQIHLMLLQPNGEIKALGVICIVVFLSILLKNLFLFLSYYYLNPIRNNIINHLREQMYGKILELPIGYFSDQRKGDIMSRLTNDLQEVEFSTVNVIETTFREPIAALLFLGYLIILSPQLTLFLVLFLPVAGTIIGKIGKSLKRESRTVQEKLGAILSTIDETIGGIRIVKGFTAEGRMRRRFDSENKELFTIKNKANRRRDLASPTSELLGVTAVVCVLWYGGRLVLKNQFLDPSQFLVYIAIISQLINPLKSLASASFNIKRGAASIERIETLINQDVSIKEIANPVELTSFDSGIELRNVSFRYDDKVILHNINLVIPKGKTIALVGSSGSGKSTLADLIPRFHDAVEGQILIDGVDIRNYSLKSLRSQMGIVTQEAFLFNDTLAANIALGIPGAGMEDIIHAAKVANADGFIIKKEEGYLTVVGDRGSKLSGGERQRVTIARAVLKNPPILILDEATSSLDTESERLVQDAINKVMEARTTLVIAHRLSTIRHADEIIVLQNGRIAERGNHDELLEQGGIYRRLVEMQEVR